MEVNKRKYFYGSESSFLFLTSFVSKPDRKPMCTFFIALRSIPYTYSVSELGWV